MMEHMHVKMQSSTVGERQIFFQHLGLMILLMMLMALPCPEVKIAWNLLIFLKAWHQKSLSLELVRQLLADDDGQFSEVDFEVMLASTWSNVEDDSLVVQALIEHEIEKLMVAQNRIIPSDCPKHTTGYSTHCEGDFPPRLVTRALRDDFRLCLLIVSVTLKGVSGPHMSQIVMYLHR
jgi:hypothetical protein